MNPTPARGIRSGLVAVLLVTLTFALRSPCKRGVKVTFIGQLALGARVAPQVVISPKSVVLAPVRVMEDILIVAVPVLVKVTVT